MCNRLLRQIEFITEIDKLKQILRQNKIIDSDRNENDAEHSWHLALMALILAEYSMDKNIDISKVIKMVLIHDLVEIDAGDTFCYDEVGYKDKSERELKAAERLFKILPNDQACEIFELWREFEDLNSSEAKFAACLDRMQPLILNDNTKGCTWQRPGVTSDMVLERNGLLKENAPELWEYAKSVIEASIKKGYLKR